jgi:hypothetical protein
MKLRTIVVSLSLLLLIAAAPVPETPNASATAASDWTFQGCFSPTGSSPCYDVYTHNGGYWMCSTCGTTKRPNENSCRPLTTYQLQNGRWCS